jgi:hypothetical protein
LVVRCHSRHVKTDTQKDRKPRFTVLEAFIVLVIVFMLGFRLVAVTLLVTVFLLCAFFPLHHSRAALWVSSVLFALAVLIPVDVYIAGFHGPLVNSKHSGLRFVSVVYGLGAQPEAGDEAVEGGCVPGIHPTRWRLVWD